MADFTSNTQQLPQWVVIAKELGIPTLLGGILGYLASFIQGQIDASKQNKKWRQNIAEQIHTQIFSYNGVVINALNQTEKQEMFVDAVSKISEAEALADLYINEEVSKNIESLKGLVFNMRDEIKQKIKAGVQSGSRHDLVSGKKYDEELRNLKNNLKKWIEKE